MNANDHDEILADQLLVAAQRGDSAQVQALISQGAFVQTQFWAGGPSPLHLCRDLACAQALLDAGADPNAPDASGATALHGASKLPDPALAKLLLSRGANPNLADRDGHTPLMVAASMLRTEPARALLESGANPRARDRNAHCLLCHALDSPLTARHLAKFWTFADLALQALAGAKRAEFFVEESRFMKPQCHRELFAELSRHGATFDQAFSLRQNTPAAPSRAAPRV